VAPVLHIRHPRGGGGGGRPGGPGGGLGSGWSIFWLGGGPVG
jgi:hypothetical protein